MSEEFKKRIIEHSEKALKLADKAETEAATQQYLIMPLFHILGYDPQNPDEIVPEAHASFADKFKNRVDYAIYKEKEPVIAVESKKVGRLSEATKGEMKGYFNAVPSVKLVILTDGLIYQLYSDTGKENMMDDEPFVTINLKEIAEDRIPENVFDALLKLRQDTFDPADVGADAQRKLHVAAYLDTLEQTFKQPSELFVRVMMDLAGIEGKKTGKLVAEQTSAIEEAMSIFFDKRLLERVGFADRQDLVKMAGVDAVTATEVAEEPADSQNEGDSVTNHPKVVTTDAERRVFEYAKHRLSFLIDRDESLFKKLDHVFMKDYKTTFTVNYKQGRKGRLFNFQEGKSPKYQFEFPENETNIHTDNLSDIDDELLRVFMQRVNELG